MSFSTRPDPDPVAPGQESAWDYPRPPRLEPTPARLTIVLGGVTIADTTRALRVLETSHPPNYYFPPDDIVPGVLDRNPTGASYCEWKGRAHYFAVRGGARIEADAAWAYERPNAAFAALRDHVAFYPGRMDECTVDGELVIPQAGSFYGGWITAAVAGPFKGGPGSRGW